jgi:pyruvate dehydrogenase E2 component (dihydrolipoamide acetyltransferase)
MPAQDFAVFGPVEEVLQTRHQRIAGAFLSRNWAQIPHVTHHDEAPCDVLEVYRRVWSTRHAIKATPLPFLIKAVVAALKQFPRFNASLSLDGERLILKKYFHVGIATETPNGLLVPVIRDCDRKSVAQLAMELTEKTQKARDKGLPMAEMSGGCFSISSLGGIGGLGFTPIINAPEVAILGVTRVAERLRLHDGQASAYSVLPLSLSYDHRVINGADAARFTRAIADLLQHPENLAAPEH